MEVTMFGGPYDGNVYAFPDGTHEVRIPVAMNMNEWLLDDISPSAPLSIRAITCPIRLTRNGYVIVWKEPK